MPVSHTTAIPSVHKKLLINDLLRGNKYKVEPSAPVISQKAGSLSFDFIDEPRLSRLEEFVKTFISDRVEAKKGYASVHDFAVTLSILMFTKRNPSKYKDGSQPTARIRKLWQCLVDQEVATRSFDAQRFSAIRNKLSELGLIDWRDHRYYPGVDGKKGKAMKWDLTDSFMELLVEVTEREENLEKAVPDSSSRSSEDMTHTSLYEVPETGEIPQVEVGNPTSCCRTCYSKGFPHTSLYEVAEARVIRRVVAGRVPVVCTSNKSTGFTHTSLYELFQEEWERCLGEGDYRTPKMVLTMEEDIPWWDMDILDRLAA